MQHTETNQNRIDFNKEVDKLLAKIAAWEFDDYYTGIALVDEFEEFARSHSDIVDQLATSETQSIRVHIKYMKKYKMLALKQKNFNSAKVLLRSDVESMKYHIAK